MIAVEDVLDTLYAVRFRYANEDQLQEGITQALGGFPGVEREVRLSTRDRVDLLLDGIGVEVKVGGSAESLTRQLGRYAESPLVRELIVVSSRIRHEEVPREINGKKVYVVPLARPW